MIMKKRRSRNKYNYEKLIQEKDNYNNLNFQLQLQNKYKWIKNNFNYNIINIFICPLFIQLQKPKETIQRRDSVIVSFRSKYTFTSLYVQLQQFDLMIQLIIISQEQNNINGLKNQYDRLKT